MENLQKQADTAAKTYANALYNRTSDGKYNTKDDTSAKTAYERTMSTIQSQNKVLETKLKLLISK